MDNRMTKLEKDVADLKEEIRQLRDLIAN